jgi:hypothetical protein
LRWRWPNAREAIGATMPITLKVGIPMLLIAGVFVLMQSVHTGI